MLALISNDLRRPYPASREGQASNCHWTSSCAWRSSAAAKGKGMFT